MAFCCATVILILGFITTLNAGDYEVEKNDDQVEYSNYEVELIECSPKAKIGESPHWDEKSQSLYYVDIKGSKYSIFRYCEPEDRLYRARIKGEPIVSFVIPVKGTKDEFAVGIGHRVGVVRWDGKSKEANLIRIVLDVENCKPYWKNRFNAAQADPLGRLFAGTMRKEECDHPEIPTYGNLFRIADDESAVTLNKPEQIRMVNGLAWDEEKNKYYGIDSCANDIKVFDYDPHTGNIWNRTTFMSFDEHGRPGGLTIDNKGNLWVAIFGGSRIVRVNGRTGKVDKRIKIPTAQVTSVTFGGKKLNELYVTTSAQKRYGPVTKKDGRLYRVRKVYPTGSPGVSTRV